MRRTSYQGELLDAIGGFLPSGFFSHWPVRGGTQWTPQRLTWVAALMAWDEGQTLNARWEHAGGVARSMHAHWKVGTSYSGFAAAMVRESPRIIAGIKAKFQQAMQAMPDRYQKRCGWYAFAADGSRVEAPLTKANEDGLGCAGRKKERAASVCNNALAHGFGPALGLSSRPRHRQRASASRTDARRFARGILDRCGCGICGL